MTGEPSDQTATLRRLIEDTGRQHAPALGDAGAAAAAMAPVVVPVG
jgi:hypothetical protein